MKRFELREHTADVAVEAEGDTMGEAFGAVADGLAAAMCDSIPEGGQRSDVEESAENPEAALYDYLSRLIYERDVEGVLPVDNEADVVDAGGEWVVRGTYRGVPLDAVTARDVKAVTYSQMELEATADGWRAYVVFDV